MILKERIYIKTIIQIDKHEAKIYIRHMYTQIIIKKFLLFIKKIYNYIKQISSTHNYKNIFLSAKYKNGKPSTKFIIK